jgi:DNA replication and repair protein RecF
MLRINNISLTYFKNYEQKQFEFTKNVVGIYGQNGVGKTNLLDAIYYCCFTKSYFTSSDSLVGNFNQEGFRLEAKFDKSETPLHFVCINRGSTKKECSLNAVPYTKLAEHVGKLPAVIIAPDDVEIIIGGSEGRRRYLDTVICQIDAAYLTELITYNKILTQRNSLLKQFFETKTQNLALLEVLNEQLIIAGNAVFEKRQFYCDALIPFIQNMYGLLSNQKETISFKYESPLQQGSFKELLNNSAQRDFASLRTNVGIHKDDIHFLIDNQPFKTIASQGQRKSLLFALKLAQFNLLQQKNGFAPILLLDDVFEKLDEQRLTILLNWICKEQTGQVIITDTHQQRLQNIFATLQLDAQLIGL